jgi:hypothetical protein
LRRTVCRQISYAGLSLSAAGSVILMPVIPIVAIMSTDSGATPRNDLIALGIFAFPFLTFGASVGLVFLVKRFPIVAYGMAALMVVGWGSVAIYFVERR